MGRFGCGSGIWWIATPGHDLRTLVVLTAHCAWENLPTSATPLNWVVARFRWDLQTFATVGCAGVSVTGCNSCSRIDLLTDTLSAVRILLSAIRLAARSQVRKRQMIALD
jgi:hypothetical protein